MLPTFIACLGAILITKLIGIHGLAYLTVQPLVFFCVYQVVGSPVAVYFVSFALLILPESVYQYKNHFFHGEFSRERYLASITQVIATLVTQNYFKKGPIIIAPYSDMIFTSFVLRQKF